MSEEELDSPSHLAAAIERLRTRKAQRDNACNLARQWLRANPAALVTIQTDGTLVIENKPAANPCGFNRAARRVFMAVGFSQVCNV